MPAKKRAKRRPWQFSLRMLMLLPVVVALYIYFIPWLTIRIKQEFNPPSGERVNQEHVSVTWRSTEEDRVEFRDSMMFYANDPFAANFTFEDFTVAPQDATTIPIGTFKARRQIIGHNYVLKLEVLVNNERIRIGSDETGWVEQSLISEGENEATWRLAQSGYERWRSSSMARDIGMLMDEWVLLPADEDDVTRDRREIRLLVRF